MHVGGRYYGFFDETGLAELWQLIGEKHDKDKNYVGDIKYSARTDLGDTWLLCNGDSVSSHDYSELSKMFPTLAGSWSNKDLWSRSESDNRINCIAYANGYWVACGTYRYQSTRYARIAYATNPNGNWTVKDLWNDSGLGSISCITYANGYWVASGTRDTGDSTCNQILYTTDPAGTWKVKELWWGGGLNCVTYANGYWVAAGNYRSGSYYARIAYATDVTGTWTQKDVWNGGYGDTITCITYANGYWCVGGLYYSGSSSARIAYATDLAGTWTTKNLWSGGGNWSIINCIAYGNGHWVVGGRYADGSYTTYSARIAYTTSTVPTGSWTTKDLWKYTSSPCQINCITYANGYFVAGGVGRDNSDYYGRLAYAASPANAWTTKDLWNSTATTDTNNINGIAYVNGYWMAGGTYFISSNYYARLAYIDASTFNLPKISMDGVYTYIKAKEE